MLGRKIKHTCLFARLRPPAKRSSSSPSSSSLSVRPSASVLFSEYPEEDKEKSSVQRRTDVAVRWRSLTCRRKSIRRSRPRRRGREEERRRGGERWSSQPGRRRGRGSEEGVGWQEGKVEDQSGEEDKCQGEEKGTPWGGCRRLHSVCVWWGKKQQKKAEWTQRARTNVMFQRKHKQPSDLSLTYTAVLRRNLTISTSKIWQTLHQRRGSDCHVALV